MVNLTLLNVCGAYMIMGLIKMRSVKADISIKYEVFPQGDDNVK